MWKKLQYRFKVWRAALQPSQAITDVDQIPLVVASVFKDEAPFLQEWLDYHIAQGVERFYLADNFSSDDFHLVLGPYISRGQVVLVQTSSSGMNARIQAKELNALLELIENEMGNKVWVAVIDVDEFLFHQEAVPLKQFLKDFKDQKLAAVLVNWMMYGTSHLSELDPKQSMLSQLTWRAHHSLGEHKMVKPILYLANCEGFFEGPHWPIPKKNAGFKHGNNVDYNAGNPMIIHEPIRLNHYWYRSESYYENFKRAKRRAFGDERSGQREADHIRACNYEQDDSISRIWPPK